MRTEGLHGYPIDDPDPTPRSITVGSWMVVGSTVFFFFAFVFAFLYLRASNSNGRWNHRDLAVSMPMSVVLLVLSLVACLLVWSGARRLARHHDLGSASGLWVAAALLLAAVVARIVLLATLGFQPTEGGYASVVVGWNLALVAFGLGALYWVVTVISGQRHAEERPSSETETPRRSHIAMSAVGCGMFLSTLAVVEIFAFVLLAVVR